MRERAGLLNLVAELRGRLDELERLVRTAPNHSILSPADYDEDGILTVTPEEYTTFRANGLAEASRVLRYQPCPAFAQFGAPDETIGVTVSSFDLSDLHRTGPEPAFGLRLVPDSENKLAWFTYDLLMPIKNAAEFVWLEWVIKLSFDQPVQSFVQIIVDGENYSEPVDVGIMPISDFATFAHIRLDRASILQASAGRAVKRIRLTFSTEGIPTPLTLYGFSVYGRV